ncbi:hypothetical protein Lalb_Chr21g0319251 [Lupinus albus]|uniref:Uncharacterized protein n=1 Tax=Lupinus albus TaxID=3870 RepID=A0A6A4N948_LUPAL|nr:hypothetical protein Lalb_Chr21g0319251 [Lupinus albus]
MSLCYVLYLHHCSHIILLPFGLNNPTNLKASSLLLCTLHTKQHTKKYKKMRNPINFRDMFLSMEKK